LTEECEMSTADRVQDFGIPVRIKFEHFGCNSDTLPFREIYHTAVSFTNHFTKSNILVKTICQAAR
jgi:hypothetical protein